MDTLGAARSDGTTFSSWGAANANTNTLFGGLVFQGPTYKNIFGASLLYIHRDKHMKAGIGGSGLARNNPTSIYWSLWPIIHETTLVHMVLLY